MSTKKKPTTRVIERVSIASLKLDPQNARRHSDVDIAAVAKSLDKFGQQTPIVVDVNGVVVKGNGTMMAAMQLGWTELEVLHTSLSGEALRAYAIADNRTGELSDWDYERLVKQLGEMEDAELLAATAWSSDEIQELLGGEHAMNASELEEDEPPELREDTVCKAGDVWQLGRHRLAVGDSRSEELLDRLFDGRLAQCCVTDPPYNVDYVGKTAEAKKIQNDKMSGVDFEVFLHETMRVIESRIEEGSAVYVCHADSEGERFRAAFSGSGLLLKQCLVWVKNVMVLGRQDYQWRHEPCQPPGTMVWTPGGQVPIESLRDGDEVVTFVTNSGQVTGVRGGYRCKVASRDYAGRLWQVAVGGLATKATDGHRFTVRFNPDASKNYAVYLMRRGDRWRVGTCRAYDSRQFGLKTRFNQEKAEQAWVLSLHETKFLAEVEETRVSLEYGIPECYWEVFSKPGQSARAASVAMEKIAAIYDALDLEGLALRAVKCLRDHGRSEDYPLVDGDSKRAAFSRRVTAQVAACNLLPGLMQVPVPYGEWQGMKTFDWRSIGAVTCEEYSGPVYSLEVETHEHYVADGIVTHNCLYGWKPGGRHRWYGGRKKTTVIDEGESVQLEEVESKGGTTRRLTVCVAGETLVFEAADLTCVSANPESTVWRCDKPSRSTSHPTMKPVKLIGRMVQNSTKKDDLVFDPFGGSGSTLVACEHLGRACYTVELDERYADVIVRRWESLTGKQAERVDD